MSPSLRIADFYESCATRDRGKRFYPRMVAWMEDARAWDELLLDFDGVEFVSPSFLDETLVRLAEECPELATRVLIRGLSDFAARRLNVALSREELAWTLTAQPTGSYALRA